jgi:4-hydroxy-2-oxoheptanedioate aldolase
MTTHATAPRLNGFIRALESGKHALSLFAPCEVESAVELQSSAYDGIVFEGEHRGWDIRALRDSLQYLLNRAQIAKSASLAPAVTPIARIPANGVERNQFLAKQALDVGCYGIVWPHISTVAEAYNAVAACRYPRLKDKPLYEPAGIRGDGPMQAARYWMITTSAPTSGRSRRKARSWSSSRSRIRRASPICATSCATFPASASCLSAKAT